MDVEKLELLEKKVLGGSARILVAAALGLLLYLCFGTGSEVRDQRDGVGAVGRELERAVEREQRAAGEAHELAGDAVELRDEIEAVRDDLGDAQREAGALVEGTDRAEILIGECEQIIAGVRARGTAH